MEELTYTDCIPLISAMLQGVLSEGLMQSLSGFAEADTHQVNICAGSISRSLNDGSDFQSSLIKADPGLPYSLVRVIVAGFQKSVLDHALEDVGTVLENYEDENDVEEELQRLARKYEDLCIEEICRNCFERELGDLIRRAECLNSEVVQLMQEGESFLHLNFTGEKEERISRPTHSLVYMTLLGELEAACDNGGVLQTDRQVYRIVKDGTSSYRVISETGNALRIDFLGIDETGRE